MIDVWISRARHEKINQGVIRHPYFTISQVRWLSANRLSVFQIFISAEWVLILTNEQRSEL